MKKFSLVWVTLNGGKGREREKKSKTEKLFRKKFNTRNFICQEIIRNFMLDFLKELLVTKKKYIKQGPIN